MRKTGILFVFVTSIACLAFGATDTANNKAAAAVPQQVRGNPQTDPPKPPRRWCEKCVKSHFECTSEDENGNCTHWKFVCDQYVYDWCD